ncbi:hypothetical protein SEA_LILMAC1015_63 [Arthrobacter phage Lilmac1015]|uniref:Uncharacterized protein n=1 Tax=Arthrobacter phage Lilmac1015 TaxID=2912653 RepID=A0AA49BNP8_9CAUD|nr:hypothetical protein SEA_LILMAC1015_63 [Arthrobacter phage Lilmac1015]
MSAPKYAAADVSGKGHLLRLRDLGDYEAIAYGPINEIRRVCEELNEADERGRDVSPPAEGEETRETQLDAMVIHHEPGAERAPELHADRTGREAYLGEDKSRPRPGSISDWASRNVLGFTLPGDGTVPLR